MESVLAYIPIDRLHALVRGEQLPDRTSGAALFADISGFTPLTEALVRVLGPQRGTEELPRQLNRVYEALITEIHAYGGSVLGFAGDAITCWFDQQTPGAADASPAGASTRAVACALALQRAMQPFARIAIPGAGTVGLAIKVAVASGPARRFVVGDPAIQLVDALAGLTIERLEAGEHLAAPGDVVVDDATIAALRDQASVQEWRTDDVRGERYAVVAALNTPVDPTPWPDLAPDALRSEQARPWLLAPIYARLEARMGEFLTELRPTVALFLRFGGIDFDNDELAQLKLDAYILWIQRILRRYDSYMLQLTIGDKGSYLYAAFGAPSAHEDDAIRACLAALELREPRVAYIEQVQIGISQGRARTGAYGALARRTYGVLGDEVNMAARLMQNAERGRVLVSQGVRQATGDRFVWEALPPLQVKGKAQPVSVFRLVSTEMRQTIRLHEPRYALPMVGRTSELETINRQVTAVLQGQGQIIGISAEAGMGKSRLVAEAVRLAQRRGLLPYGGECQSYGTNTSYLVWHNIWRGFFDIDPSWSVDEQIGALKVALARIDPELLPRLPLLGAVLNLSIPDNELTRHFEPRLRKTSLETLLVSCVRARAVETPVLLVLEDCHWLDPLSHDLLEVIGRAIPELPVLVIMAYRPPQLQHLLTPRVSTLAHFTELPLTILPPAQVEELVRLKIAQLFDAPDDLPDGLVTQINTRAQGNPFYVEELLNYLRDRGLDPRRPADLAQIELPPSMHSLILSRIDCLNERQKTLLKVASVIGRLFRAAILWGVGTFSGDRARVLEELGVLSELELTPLDTPEPELVYLFKHIVTQEVAYESLPFATRAVLHEQIGTYIEQAYATTLDQVIDLLAFHFDRSEHVPRRRQYLMRAGELAQASYANSAAIDYYRRALPLLEQPEQGGALLKLGQVLELVGQWDEAGERYEQALALAEQHDDAVAQAHAHLAIGELLRKRGSYIEAGQRYDQALNIFTSAGERSGLARTLSCAGSLAFQQGSPATSWTLFEQCLAIRRELGDPADTAKALNNLGIVARAQGEYARARAFFDESLAIQRALNNRWAVATSLSNLANLALSQDDHALAQAATEEGITLQREVGDTWALAVTLNNLGNALREQGDYAAARRRYAEALRTMRALGDRYNLTYLLENVGQLAALVGQPERALRLVEAATTLRAAIGSPRPARDQARIDERLAQACADLSAMEQEAARSAGRAMDVYQAIDDALELA